MAVQTNENVAGFHAIAVLDVDFSNDTAIAVLYFLDAVLDDERAGSDHRAGQIGQRRPVRTQGRP